MNFRACLKLQNVSGNSGARNRIFMMTARSGEPIILRYCGRGVCQEIAAGIQPKHAGEEATGDKG